MPVDGLDPYSAPIPPEYRAEQTPPPQPPPEQPQQPPTPAEQAPPPQPVAPEGTGRYVDTYA